MWTRRRPPPRDRRLGCGHVKGFRLGGLTAEEAVALERPAMTYVCEQLRQRLGQQVRGLVAVAAPHQRTSANRPLPVAAATRRLQKCPRRTSTVRTPVPEAAADIHGVRRVRFRNSLDTGRGVRLVAAVRTTT